MDDFPSFEKHERIFKKVSSTWKRLTNEYCKVSKDEAPYSHNEMTNRGFFAGAHWMNGALVLEEYYADRTECKLSGRVDLWIEYPNEHKRYMVETKNVKVNFEAFSQKELSEIKRIRRKMQEACRQVSEDSIKENYSAIRLAAVFVVLEIGKRSIDECDRFRKGLIRGIKDNRLYDAMIVNFPKSWKEMRYDDLICPGVILLLKELEV